MAEGDVVPRRRQWVEVEESKARAAKIHEKIRHLSLSMARPDFTAGLSKKDRAAKLSKAKEENRRNIHEYLSLLQCKPDLSGVTETERAAEAERLRQKDLEEARRLRMEDEGNPRASRLEALARLRIIDFDPKQHGRYHNRFSFFNEKTFDPGKESPIAPMRFTEAVYKSESDYRRRICEAVNILSVKIACSDVGFPIHVYGTVIARDSIDQLCVYHFRRDSDHCQLINSEDESLILTGPKRGLAMLDDIYVETDLKIKDHLGQDRELSKGVFYIKGISRSFEECTVETKSLATRLSTVDVRYAVIARAVEATIAVEVLHGVFCGKITAYTTSIKDSLLLYDSDEVVFTLTGDDFDFGAFRLMRSVVSVSLKDMLIVEVHTGDGKSRSILFTPRVNGGDEGQITVGATVMCVKDQSLILTGPKRGLAMVDGIYVETDLKIKDHLGQDRELSKGVFYIRGISRSFEKCTVETKSLPTRLSTVDVTYAVIARAVEATIAVEVLRGVFFGKITAYTASIKDSLLLYDSDDELAFTVTGDDSEFGAIRLMRSVVSVFLKDTLIVEVHAGDGKSERILFTPRVNGGDEGQITVSATVMRVKVVWSVMDP